MFPGLVLNMFHSQYPWLGVCDWVSLLKPRVSSQIRRTLGTFDVLGSGRFTVRKKIGPWAGVGGHREEEEVAPGDMGGGGQGSGLGRTLTG